MIRIESVESVRLAAITAVIAIHTTPFAGYDVQANELYYYLDVFISQITRFAVPFFFVISGFFFGIKVAGGVSPLNIAKKSAKRIFTLFLGWSLVYLLPYNISAVCEYGLLGPIKEVYWAIDRVIEDPVTFLFQGTKVHLWFLMSLVMSILISAVLLYKKQLNSLILLSICLYVFGVFARAYGESPLGIAIDFNTRNGPFFGLIFFVTGYCLARLQIKENWFYYGIMIFLIGTCLHFLEVFYLFEKFNVPLRHDYVFGTYFMGVGVAVMSLSNHKWLCNNFCTKTGKMTLGIYASHFIFIDLLRPINRMLNSAVWEIGFVFLVLVLSVLFSALLKQWRFTKFLVE